MPTPTPINANRLSKRGLVATVALLGLSVGAWNYFHLGEQPICCTFGNAANRTPGITSERASAVDNAAQSIPVVATPIFLKGLLPEHVHGLAVQDVKGSNGHCKLVVWSHWPEANHGAGESTSRMALVAVNQAGKGSIVWQTEDQEGLYEPRIKAEPDWQYHGHQVYAVLRQKGAEWTEADPVWIDTNSVHTLAAVEGEGVEISALDAGGKHQLVSYSRGEPQTVDIAEIYRWNGEKFVRAGMERH